MKAHCVTKGIKEYEFYVDAGFTGSNIDRVEMQRMISDVKQEKIEMVIVYKLDRLSRSQKDTLYLIEDVFNLYGAEFISVNENLDTSTPIGRAMLGIMSAFAQLEREMIQERTQMGMLERVKEGYWMGGGKSPLGYDYDKEKGILVKNEDFKKIQQMHELFHKGLSYGKIAQMSGIEYDVTVRNALKRITYAGYIPFKGEIYKGKHEAIITLDMFKKTQQRMEERSVRSDHTSEYLLTGLLECGECGAKMRYQNWSKRGAKVYCYSQQTHNKRLIKDPNCKNNKYWSDKIEEIVVKDILTLDWTTIIGIKPNSNYTSIKNVLKNQIDEKRNKLKRLYQVYSESTDDILLEVIEEIKNDLSVLDSQLLKEIEKKEITKKAKSIEKILSSLSVMWTKMSFKEKQNIVRTIISKIVVYKPHLENGNEETEISIHYTFLGTLEKFSELEERISIAN